MQQINNLSARITAHKAQIKAATDRVLASGWLVLGPEVKKFEEAFANYLGASHCLSIANGTDAIELALRALGVGSGDRVATVANAGMYATTAMLAIGAEPFFLDVDIETHGTTLAEVMRAVEAGVQAVVVTHLYGLALPEIEEITQYCKMKNVPVLEDCAQAHGAAINGKYVGTFGDAASFSFYPTKNLGALGDGGAIVTNNIDTAEKVRLLRQYGWASKYCVQVPGARNSRLDELQAAILLEFLPHLDTANSRRRAIAATYSAKINNKNMLTPQAGKREYVAHLYVVRSAYRDSLRDYLRTCHIASDIHYPIPDYRQPLFGERYASMRLKNTEQLASEILTLPCYPEMTDAEVEHVIQAVNGWSL